MKKRNRIFIGVDSKYPVRDLPMQPHSPYLFQIRTEPTWGGCYCGGHLTDVTPWDVVAKFVEDYNQRHSGR